MTGQGERPTTELSADLRSEAPDDYELTPVAMQFPAAMFPMTKTAVSQLDAQTVAPIHPQAVGYQWRARCRSIKDEPKSSTHCLTITRSARTLVIADWGPGLSSLGGDRLDYVTAQTVLRAPRAAIVFPAVTDDWTYWARCALHAASLLWGGKGFILVPADGRDVDPVIRRAVRAYDPDYVVAYHPTVAQWDGAHPGFFDDSVGERQLSLGEREYFASQTVTIEALERTRRELVASCATYATWMQQAGGVSGSWYERTDSLPRSNSGTGPLTPIHRMARPSDQITYGLRPDVLGDLGLAAQVHFGVTSAPNAAASAPLESGEEGQLIRGLYDWPLDQRTRPGIPDSLLDLTATLGARNGPTCWEASSIGLVDVTDGQRPPYERFLVLGDAPNDFALALIWNRLYGPAGWVPDRLWQEGRSPKAKILLEALQLSSLREGWHGDQWCITTTSLDEEVCAEFRDAIIRQRPKFHVGGRPVVVEHTSIAVDNLDCRLEFPARGQHFLGVDGQFSDRQTVPVVRDRDGSATLASAPAPPLIVHERLTDIQAELSWQVDLDVFTDPVPPARRLPPEALLHPDESVHSVWIRSSRRGVSFEALSMGFVPSGALPADRLARPRIKQPSTLAWARAKASAEGFSVEISSAGRHADLLSTMLGSRASLTRVVCGDLEPALKAFQPNRAKTDLAYPDDEGVVIKRLGYLNIEGIAKLANISVTSARAQCDELLGCRVLSRGLILNCAVCGDLDFVPIDRLRQINTCLRCGESNELQQVRWRIPDNEPRWFYDLHPAATTLFSDHGHLPIHLANYLRSRAKNRRSYADTGEFVVSQKSANDGKQTAEADLLALVDGKLIVAEAKQPGKIGNVPERQKAAKKRMQLAAIFGCDEVIFATAQAAWTPTAVSAIKAAAANFSWGSVPVPRLRTITGLGTSNTVDHYLD